MEEQRKEEEMQNEQQRKERIRQGSTRVLRGEKRDDETGPRPRRLLLGGGRLNVNNLL